MKSYFPAPCPDDEFHCSSQDECIPFEWVCDDEDDCDNGEDENGCGLYYISYCNLSFHSISIWNLCVLFIFHSNVHIMSRQNYKKM